MVNMVTKGVFGEWFCGVVDDVDGVASLFKDACEIEEPKRGCQASFMSLGLADEEGLDVWIEQDDVNGPAAPFVVAISKGLDIVCCLGLIQSLQVLKDLCDVSVCI